MFTLGIDGEEFMIDSDSDASASNVSNDNSTETNYYDLDIANDCGPDPGVCVMPLTQEYDSDGNEYQPDPQIKGTAVCLNDDGTEDFHLVYDYYNTGKENISNAYWLCPKKSTIAMWIVSLSSRIVGDAMYDHASPTHDSDTPTNNRSTIVNPRKVYSLTTGMLQWTNVDIANYHNADCALSSGDCKGIDFVLDVPVNGGYTKSNGTQHLIVGESSIPTDDLSPYSYNNTDVYIIGADAPYRTKGDVLLSYNFKSYEWERGASKDYNCSEASEDYLRHVVNNHYYMDSGLLASYTSALYYLLKEGVVKTTTTVGAVTTLEFDGNEQWMDVVVSIPAKSMAITLAGITIVLIGAIVILALTTTGSRAVHGFSHPEHMTAEMVAQMMFDGGKYPQSVLARRFVGLTAPDASESIDEFTIGGLVLYHGENGESYTLPIQNLNATARVGFDSPTSGDLARFQHDEAELVRLELGKQGLRKLSNRSLKVL